MNTLSTFAENLELPIIAKGDKLEFILVYGMYEEAGNEYKETDFTANVSILAAQYTYEKDGFGDNEYDKDATYPVASAAEMKEALANGGIVSVNKDIKTDNIVDNVAARITISKPTTLNLDAKIISPDDMSNNVINFCALIVDADTTINAGKNGGIDTGVNGGYALNVREGANLTITGGSYYGGGTAVQVQEGTLTITGGHFAVEAFGEPYGYNFLLNCIDSAYKNGSAKIIVKGGTFVTLTRQTTRRKVQEQTLLRKATRLFRKRSLTATSGTRLYPNKIFCYSFSVPRPWERGSKGTIRTELTFKHITAKPHR